MAEDDFELVYLTLPDALELYAAIVAGTTERAAATLRFRAGLEGALARPATHAHYQGADLAIQAAVLAHVSPRARRSSTATSGSRSSRC
ncbi:MAG: hypothetical protein MSC30_10115 [Gaiellaceae bacterium MAG52_C11]|nr:hypothetical protein [Candidatus Gaiellasilicea maunaloa]